MWTCPNCHHKFVNTNQSHSCGNYTLDGFLAGKSPIALSLFHYFIDQYKQIGPFELHPVKTRVALLTLMRFCAINRIGKNFIDGHLVLVTPYPEAACFYKIDNLENRFFIHHFRVFTEADVNDELRNYMLQAYQIGKRKHIK